MLDTYGIMKGLRLTQARHIDAARDLLYHNSARFTGLCESKQPHSAVDRAFCMPGGYVEKRICVTCGASFRRPPSSRDKNCSRACSVAHRGKQSDEALAGRFWGKVNKTDGCWLWTGKMMSGESNKRFPYGQLNVKHRNLMAHRISYELTCGPIPPGMMVLHRCDNPICVRSDHLFLGTHQDNMDDMKAKGRSPTGYVAPEKRPRGERIGNATLTADTVLEIRSRYIPGRFGCKRLAQEYGISATHIKRIVRRRAWEHLL
jgi:hypothetical protein